MNQFVAVRVGKAREARRIMRRRADHAAVICRALVNLLLGGSCGDPVRERARKESRTEGAKFIKKFRDEELRPPSCVAALTLVDGGDFSLRAGIRRAPHTRRQLA